MSSGAFAEAGNEYAAYQNQIFYLESDASSIWADLQVVDEASTSCYTIEAVEQPNGGDWGTYILFGGPGGPTCM